MHLFAGAGGGLLADLILGHTPVVAVEWEPYACQVLRERAADGWFPGLSVWEGDVRLFDPSEYAGSVDCIHAGFPCQDISVAGKQAGVGTETRSGLYREVLRIAGVVRPRFLYLENVSAILSNGLGVVLADLAALGYDARWCCLKASDVGANHHRDRWWLLAYPAGGNDKGGELHPGNIFQALVNRQAGSSNPSDTGSKDVADTDSSGCEEQRRTVADGTQHQAAECGGWWEAEPDVGRVVDGFSTRFHRLKALGNAQVPLQAAAAWRLLGGE